MAHDADQIPVYLEIGRSRAFAAALDWPGWCRGGRDEAAALQALCDYGSRYARVLQQAQIVFRVPTDISALVVVERRAGNVTTGFGAPNGILAQDTEPISTAELQRWQEVLRACWRAFDTATQEAIGRTLSTGPRGGGRDLTKIVQHMRDGDAGYLASLGGTFKPGDADDPAQALAGLRQAILTTLIAAARGEVPARGPRGGVRWPPRYFVRRLAWHTLDHAWEIEDRSR